MEDLIFKFKEKEVSLNTIINDLQFLKTLNSSKAAGLLSLITIVENLAIVVGEIVNKENK